MSHTSPQSLKHYFRTTALALLLAVSVGLVFAESAPGPVTRPTGTPSMATDSVMPIFESGNQIKNAGLAVGSLTVDPAVNPLNASALFKGDVHVGRTGFPADLYIQKLKAPTATYTNLCVDTQGKVLQCPAPGKCGSTNGTTVASAPTTNLCIPQSAASSVAGTGPWTWSCAGFNGGAPASCSATKAVIVATPSITPPVIYAAAGDYTLDLPAGATTVTVDGYGAGGDDGTPNDCSPLGSSAYFGGGGGSGAHLKIQTTVNGTKILDKVKVHIDTTGTVYWTYVYADGSTQKEVDVHAGTDGTNAVCTSNAYAVGTAGLGGAGAVIPVTPVKTLVVKTAGVDGDDGVIAGFLHSVPLIPLKSTVYSKLVFTTTNYYHNGQAGQNAHSTGGGFSAQSPANGVYTSPSAGYVEINW